MLVTGLAFAALVPGITGEAFAIAIAAAFLAHRPLGPGDVGVLNDPFAGGSHLPDLTMVQAVYAPEGRLLFHVANRAHHSDIGGASPGSMAPAEEIYQEGLSLPPVRLVRGGVLDEEVLSTDGVAPPARTTILAFDLARLGANSLFGNLEVRSAGGDDVIGLARGVGVYPEIDSRLVRIPLRRQPAAGEVLEVTFVDDDLTPGRVVAKASLIAS